MTEVLTPAVASLRRQARSDPWTPPRNLGVGVNSPGNDWSPAISADDHMLIFQSDWQGGLGGDDLWITIRNRSHRRGVRRSILGPMINTPYDDAKADFSADDRTLLFMSTRPAGAGSLDIWTASVSRR